MARHEVLISGFGGQGVAVAGRALGRAAVLAGLRATMLLSHGTETRGGYVRSQVVISDENIDSPVVENPDIFCALSQAAYNRFLYLATQGAVFYDPELVSPEPAPEQAHLVAIPARRLALENTGTELAANCIVLGAVLRRLDLISLEQGMQALNEIMPRHAKLNLRAAQAGYRCETD